VQRVKTVRVLAASIILPPFGAGSGGEAASVYLARVSSPGQALQKGLHIGLARALKAAGALCRGGPIPSLAGVRTGPQIVRAGFWASWPFRVGFRKAGVN
jgi:hypothetical protein